MFIDTHCHLDAPELCQRLQHVLARAREAGVDRFIIPGVDPAAWEVASALAKNSSGMVHAACGLHPMLANNGNGLMMERIDAVAADCVAIGEIGLDYSLEVSRQVQIQFFKEQLRIAARRGLPVIIHCRKAFQDLLTVLKEEGAGQVGGVMHAYSGSPEMAREFIRLGFAISIAGTVTYQNAVKPLELVKQIPLEHLVLETDSPDLTPVPFRGEVNEPARLKLIAQRVAELKGVSLAEVETITTENARRVFSI